MHWGASQAVQGAVFKKWEQQSVQESSSVCLRAPLNRPAVVPFNGCWEKLPQGPRGALVQVRGGGGHRNCLPCLKSTMVWRKLIYYIFISVSLTMSFLESRLSSACSDKKLSPVRLMVSSGLHHDQCGLSREMAKTSLLFFVQTEWKCREVVFTPAVMFASLVLLSLHRWEERRLVPTVLSRQNISSLVTLNTRQVHEDAENVF